MAVGQLDKSNTRQLAWLYDDHLRRHHRHSLPRSSNEHLEGYWRVRGQVGIRVDF